MPKYHVLAGASIDGNDETEVKCSIRPGLMATYRWHRPIGAFDWPMDSMLRDAGHEYMNYDELLVYLQATPALPDEAIEAIDADDDEAIEARIEAIDDDVDDDQAAIIATRIGVIDADDEAIEARIEATTAPMNAAVEE